MASTYSNLKIQLMATGENSGTWGNVTNDNLGIAIEEAIVGSADVTFASGPVTLTLTDTNASQTARNLRLNLIGTSGGAQNLIVPAIEKVYIVNNGCADTITVKNNSGTGIAVPAGRSYLLYNNGTNVVNGLEGISVASGGTGLETLTAESVVIGNGTDAVKFVAPGSSSNVLTSNGTAWVSQAAASTTNANAITTGILSAGVGGTGANTLTAESVVIGNGTSAVKFVAPGTSSNVLTSNGTAWVSQAAGGGGGGTPTVQTYDSGTSATWTKPASANWILIEIWGGGGSGGKGSSSSSAGGGGGGAYNSALIPFANLQGSVTYTVGAGGASRTTAGNGNVGGTSSVSMGSFAGGGTKTLFSYGGGGGGGSGTGGQSGGGGGGGGQSGAGQVGAIQTTSGRSDASITGFGGNGGYPGFGLGSRSTGSSSCFSTIGTTFLAGNGSSGGGGGGLGSATVAVATLNAITSAWQGAGSIYGGGGGGGGAILATSTATLNNGGSSLYGGGGGGGGHTTTTAGNGGESVWGGGGSNGTTGSTVSGDGGLPAGGTGGTEGGNSGTGGGGRVRFTYW